MRRTPGFLFAIAVMLLGLIASVGFISGAGAQDARRRQADCHRVASRLLLVSRRMRQCLPRGGRTRRSTA